MPRVLLFSIEIMKLAVLKSAKLTMVVEYENFFLSIFVQRLPYLPLSELISKSNRMFFYGNELT